MATADGGGFGDADHVIRNQQRFVEFAEMSFDGVCIHQTGRIVYANTIAARWMRVDPGVRLIGQDVAEFMPAEYLVNVERRLEGTERTHSTSAPSEVGVDRPQMSAIDMQAASVPIDWNGRPAVLTIIRDSTDLRAAAVLDEGALVDHVSDAVIGVTADGDVTSWNVAAETIYGRSREQVLHRPVSTAVGAPIDADRVLRSGGVLHTTHVAIDGSSRSVRVSAAHTGNGFVLICTDLTALRRAERYFEAVVTAMDAGLVVYCPDGEIGIANPAARRMFEGLTDARAPFGTDLPLFDVDGRLIAADARPLERALTQGEPQTDRIVGIDRPDGHRMWLSVSVRLLGTDAGSPLLCTFVDVTTQILANERLAHVADHDSLTGLPNRAYALAQLTASLSPQADKRVRAVLFIDLDDVKVVNDSLGHGAGDTAITTAATRMRDALREGDVIARLAGDEFVILLFDEVGQSDLAQLVRDLHIAVATPISHGQAEIAVTASIGVAVVGSDDRRDATQLLSAADSAMYAAKASGPGRTRYAP